MALCYLRVKTKMQLRDKSNDLDGKEDPDPDSGGRSQTLVAVKVQ